MVEYFSFHPLIAYDKGVNSFPHAMKSASYLKLVLLSCCLMLFAAPAQAQKPSSKYRAFPAYGFEFKPLKDFLDVPVNPQKKNAGVIGNFSAEKGPSVKTDGNERFVFNPTCTVFKIVPKAATTDHRSGSGSLSGRIKASKPKEDFGKDYVIISPLVKGWASSRVG